MDCEAKHEYNSESQVLNTMSGTSSCSVTVVNSSSSSLVESKEDNRRICRHFLRRYGCRYGDSCKFRHSTPQMKEHACVDCGKSTVRLEFHKRCADCHDQKSSSSTYNGEKSASHNKASIVVGVGSSADNRSSGTGEGEQKPTDVDGKRDGNSNQRYRRQVHRRPVHRQNDFADRQYNPRSRKYRCAQCPQMIIMHALCQNCHHTSQPRRSSFRNELKDRLDAEPPRECKSCGNKVCKYLYSRELGRWIGRKYCEACNEAHYASREGEQDKGVVYGN